MQPLQASWDNLAASIDRAAEVGFESSDADTLSVPLQDLSGEEWKRCLPDSVLLMNDGSLAFAPHTRAVVMPAGQPNLRVNLWTRCRGPGQEKDKAWLANHVDLVMLGVLTNNAGKGSKAANLKVNGVSALIRMVDTDPIQRIRVSVGTTDMTMHFTEAQALLEGLEVRKWVGGDQTPPLVSEIGLPDLPAASIINIPAEMSAGGPHPLSGIRVGALTTLGLIAGADPSARELASFLCGVADRGATADAVTLCVVMFSLVLQGVTSAQQSQHTLATSAVGEELCASIGPLWLMRCSSARP